MKWEILNEDLFQTFENSFFILRKEEQINQTIQDHIAIAKQQLKLVVYGGTIVLSKIHID